MYESIVKRWFDDVFAKGDEIAVNELLSPEVVVYSQGHDEGYVGRNNFKSWLKWYRSSFVDSQWTVNDIIESGNTVVVRYTGHSTYKGGLLDIPPSDQRIKETGILIFRMDENNQVAEMWCEMSDLQVMQQIGVFPK